MTLIIIVGLVILGAYLLIIGLCVSAGRDDRMFDRFAQERAAREATRPDASIIVFPSDARSPSSTGVPGDPSGRSSDDRSDGEPAA